MKRFLSKEVAAASSGFLFHAMRALENKNKRHTIDDFVSVLRTCLQYEDIRFLQISLIRHKALLRKPFYGLQGFASSFYLAPPLFEMALDWEWMYQPYYDFCDKVRAESKRYVMQISKQDLDQICMLELDESKLIAKQLFFETLSDLIRSEDFCSFGVNAELQIQLSDYMGQYEELFTFTEQTLQLGALMNGVFQN